jgi:hypothetical protein
MASFSMNVEKGRKFHLKSMEEIPQVIFDHNIPKCKGVPQSLLKTKCVTLHNEIGVAVAEGVCHSISSELVMKISGLLKDTYVVDLISKNLKEDKFLDD